MEPEIYARIKPLNYRYKNCLSKSDKELILSLPETHKYGTKKTLTYCFDKIFDSNSTQVDLINQVCKPSVEDLFSGINSLLIVHGANKSGKEYTIYGNEKDNGIIQASLLYLFHLIEDRKSQLKEAEPHDSSDSDECKSLYKKIPNHKWHQRVPYEKYQSLNEDEKYSVFITYTGLVQNEFIDLLSLDNSKKGEKATEVEIKSINEVIQLLLFGLASRNESISHIILTIKLSLGNNRYAKFSIVDLAYQNNNLKENECIKSSIMALRNCFETLKEKRYLDVKIPYRESKLTWVLKNFLCSDSKIKIILCLNPSQEEISHSCNVLKFANIKLSVESNFNLTSTPKKDTVSSFFKNFGEYEKIGGEESELEIYEEFKEEKPADDEISSTIGDEKSSNSNRCQDITKLINRLNELQPKIRQIKFNNSFDNKINDLIGEIERYLVKDVNLTRRKNSVTTLGNETESFTKVSTLKNLNETPSKPKSGQNDKKLNPKLELAPKIRKISNHIKSTLKLKRNENFEFKNGVPVANRRGQKRSKSVEVWLDHKPQNMAILDTLMQPTMPKKNSVKKLEFKDTKRSSKYVLTHQQQDEYGEVVTNLIKGDIIKSPSGGSSVIFTDIERLQLKSPRLTRSRQRKSSGILEKNPFIIEDKCSIGIEGHPKIRRNLTFR